MAASKDKARAILSYATPNPVGPYRLVTPPTPDLGAGKTKTPVMPVMGGTLVNLPNPVKPTKQTTPVAPPMADKLVNVPKQQGRVVDLANPDEYGMNHRPSDPDFGAPLHDLTKVYPSDVYSPQGRRIYNTGDKQSDAQSFDIADQVRGKPDAFVTIYRAIPRNIKDTVINPGDWVTTSPEYAKQHGRSNLGGKYKLISMRVRADEVYTSGDSINEWGYFPKDKNVK